MDVHHCGRCDKARMLIPGRNSDSGRNSRSGGLFLAGSFRFPNRNEPRNDRTYQELRRINVGTPKMDVDEDRKAIAYLFLCTNSYLLPFHVKASDSQKSKEQINNSTFIVASRAVTTNRISLLPYLLCVDNDCINIYDIDILVFG